MKVENIIIYTLTVCAVVMSIYLVNTVNDLNDVETKNNMLKSEIDYLKNENNVTLFESNVIRLKTQYLKKELQMNKKEHNDEELNLSVGSHVIVID